MSLLTSYNVISEIVFNESNSVSTITYRISINEGEDGWLIVTSPDLPALITQGRTENEAIRNAIEVIRLLNEEKNLEDNDFKLLIMNDS